MKSLILSIALFFVSAFAFAGGDKVGQPGDLFATQTDDGCTMTYPSGVDTDTCTDVTPPDQSGLVAICGIFTVVVCAEDDSPGNSGKDK